MILNIAAFVVHGCSFTLVYTGHRLGGHSSGWWGHSRQIRAIFSLYCATACSVRSAMICIVHDLSSASVMMKVCLVAAGKLVSPSSCHTRFHVKNTCSEIVTIEGEVVVKKSIRAKLLRWTVSGYLTPVPSPTAGPSRSPSCSNPSSSYRILYRANTPGRCTPGHRGCSENSYQGCRRGIHRSFRHMRCNSGRRGRRRRPSLRHTCSTAPLSPPRGTASSYSQMFP